jgi:branched-chain amino acid transport system substrate-binding protein
MKSLVHVVGAAVLAAIVMPAAAQTQGVTDDSVVIGAFGPITGPAAYIGLAGRDGMNLAVKEINAAGGVNGRKINVVFEDDAHSPTRGLAAAKKLLEQDKVFMLMSVGGSNATAGTIDYVRDSKAVMYVSIASVPQVTWPFARNMFRGGTTETARYGELYAEFLTGYYKTKKIAIMSGREEYPRNEGDATVAKLKSWFDVAPVTRVEFNIGDKDFTPQLVDVQRANPDVIAFFGNPAEAAIAMRQAKELGLKQPFFVGSNMVDPALIAAARGASEGVAGFSLIPYLPGSKNPEMVKWEAAWRKEYPSAPAGRPNNFDLLAYADMYVVADAMKRAGRDLNTESFTRALEATRQYRVGAIATPRTFSTKHHIGNLTLVPLMVHGGEWDPVNWQSSRESDILKRYQ